MRHLTGQDESFLVAEDVADALTSQVPRPDESFLVVEDGADASTSQVPCQMYLSGY